MAAEVSKFFFSYAREDSTAARQRAVAVELLRESTLPLAVNGQSVRGR
jgi:hypothetical protein